LLQGNKVRAGEGARPERGARRRRTKGDEPGAPPRCQSCVHLAAQIAEEFRVLLDEQRGIAWAEVLTAIPLDEEQKRRVAARLGEVTGKQVNVDAAVDPSILGGLIARIGDTLIDGSTRSRLLALKKELMGAS
jgi:F0F1-type ATP synthase delta subunit